MTSVRNGKSNTTSPAARGSQVKIENFVKNHGYDISHLRIASPNSTV